MRIRDHRRSGHKNINMRTHLFAQFTRQHIHCIQSDNILQEHTMIEFIGTLTMTVK